MLNPRPSSDAVGALLYALLYAVARTRRAEAFSCGFGAANVPAVFESVNIPRIQEGQLGIPFLASLDYRWPTRTAFPRSKSTSMSFSLVGIRATTCLVRVSITAPPSG